jgi:hypothetical protein
MTVEASRFAIDRNVQGHFVLALRERGAMAIRSLRRCKPDQVRRDTPRGDLSQAGLTDRGAPGMTAMVTTALQKSTNRHAHKRFRSSGGTTIKAESAPTGGL